MPRHPPARANSVRAAKSNLCRLVTADRPLEAGPLPEAVFSAWSMFSWLEAHGREEIQKS